jgi:short-subunit dehydrogenase
VKEKYSSLSYGSFVASFPERATSAFCCSFRYRLSLSLSLSLELTNSEIIAICSEIGTEHINTLCGQNVEFFNFKLVVRKVTTGY